MSHFFPSEYEVTDWFWMNETDYLEKLEFETFDMKPMMSKSEAEDMTARMQAPDFVASPFGWEGQLQHHIKNAGGTTIWQFNVVNKNVDGWIRQLACLGQGETLKRWSWFDAYVKWPVLNITRRLMNHTLYFRRKREWAEWEKHLRDHKDIIISTN